MWPIWNIHSIFFLRRSPSNNFSSIFDPCPKFFRNPITESVLKLFINDFFLAQQDYNRKLLWVKLTFGANCKSYTSKYLMGIKAKDDDKFDTLTNKRSKFLVYYFNNWLNKQNWLVQLVRHSIIVEDEVGLAEFQHQNWSYFTEKIIGISENLADIEIDESENEIV